MFGRQTFLELVADQHEQRRRNEFIRQLVANQGQRVPFTELSSIPSLRNDGLTFDLNFVVFEDTDHIQPNDAYFRTQQNNFRNAPNSYLLDYIRQMEERYITMERELTRTKMLIPMVTRNMIPVHQKSQTDVNWEEFHLAKKHGHSSGSSSRNQDRSDKVRENRNQERTPSKKKHHTTRKNKEFIGRTSDNNIDWAMHKNLFQNLQSDTYPSKIPINHTCRPRTLNNNTTAVCSTHNVGMKFLPEISFQSTDISRSDWNRNFKERNNISKVTDKCDAVKILDSSKKCLTSFKIERIPSSKKKTLMEACQRFDKKHEPETSCHTDFDVKHEDHMQTGSAVNTPTFRPIMGSEFESTSEVGHRESSAAPFKKRTFFENTDIRRKENSQANQMYQGNRNHWSNHLKKLPYESARSANDSPRNFARLVPKNVRGQKRTPTPRSNVHTAYTPMVQSSVSNSILDPNEFTIRLLRLAVLLYAPALMPALNSLIARQNYQTSIPIPCFEGSNDVMAQVFRILSSQQCVPNLPYAASTRSDENSQSRKESNSPNSSFNLESRIEKRLTDDPSSESCTSKQENNSIAVNTSLESCTCNNPRLSSPQCSESSLVEQDEAGEWKMFA